MKSLKTLFQYLHILVCYHCINVGIIKAWPSSSVLIFTSNDTTLNRPMSQTEISLFGSLQCAGAVVGTAIAGLLLDKFGRKRSTLLYALTFVIAWCMIAVGKQVEIILTAVFISGIGSAIFMVITVYVSEICENSIRGTMTACPIMFYGTGLMISYLLGGVLTYNAMVYVYLTMTVVGVIVVSVLKESPTSLMAKGTENVEIVNLTTEDTSDRINRQRKTLLGDLFEKLSANRKQMAVSFILMSSYVLQGYPIIQVYLEPLFKEAVPSDVMSANLCSILTAILAVLAGVVSAYLTDTLGRRPLIIYSSAITGVLCTIIGTQIQFQWGPKWLSAVVIYIYIIFYTFGAGTIPFVINVEVFLPEVKNILSTLVMEWSWICNFIMLYVYPPALSVLGVAPIFYFFAVVCFATSFFCICCMPETKGLSIDAIQKLFK